MRGAVAATACYLLWGVVPLYWRLISGVDPVELIAHRNLWSLALLTVLLAFQRAFGSMAAPLRTPRSLGINALSASLLTANWLVYVWGVNTGHVIEASLGYFLVPLVNVAAARYVLHEHLSRAQSVALVFAFIGVGIMMLQLGRPPWVALMLAGSWGGYSLLRKRSPLPPVTGLAVETLLIAPAAIAFLLWQNHTGKGMLGRVDFQTHLLVFSSGIITAIPLLLFAYAARRIRLSTLGLLQYFSPTVQLALGVWVFHEPFSRARFVGFGFIWAGLALYTADNLWRQRRAAMR